MCKFHPETDDAGSCSRCETGYCSACEVRYTTKESDCLSCGAQFANKRLVRSYVAAGIGVAFAAILAPQVAREAGWATALGMVAFYPYMFWATYFGWFYGAKLWPMLGRWSDKFEGTSAFIASVFLISLRVTVALIGGMFGGAIIQFLNYRQIVQRQQLLAQAA